MADPAAAPAQGTPPPEQGIVDALWSLLTSGFSAFAGWVGDHWADIGLGFVAVALTMLATWGARGFINWLVKRFPVEDDTHKLLVRNVAFGFGFVWSGVLGFPEHFGNAIGVNLLLHEGWAIFAGGCVNGGSAIGIWHFVQWFRFSDDPMAKFLRRLSRVKAQQGLKKATGVTDEQIDSAKTTRGHPAVTEEDLKALALENDTEEPPD